MFSPHATSCRSVQKMSESAFKSFLIDNNGYINPITTNASFLGLEVSNQPVSYFDTYTGNGYVDIIRPSVVYETGTLYGDTCMAFVTKSVIEIDEPSDLDMARRLFQVGLIES